MNERIRELWSQAGGHYNSGNQHTWPEYTIDDPKKFTELIVKECISTVENLSPGYDDYRNQIEDAFRRDCVEQMKQHFGVEELYVCEHDWYSAKNPVVLNGSVCVKCGAIDPREPEELKND